jgi:hypothetical protein
MRRLLYPTQKGVNDMPEKLPPLQPSHWPQVKEHHTYRPPLHTERDHDEMVKAHPEYYVRDPDALPYAAFTQKDGAQFLVDHNYFPMWWRPRNYSYQVSLIVTR